MNLILSGVDARLRGERVSVHHVERVPATRDIFGQRIRPHYRACVIWPNGQWSNDVPLHDLALIEPE